MLPRSAFHENGFADSTADERAGHAARLGGAKQRAHVAGLLNVDRGEDERIRLRTDLCRGDPLAAGDGDDARRALHRAQRIEHGVGCFDDVDALALETLREQPFLGLRRQPGRGDRDGLELQAGRSRIVHEVRAVQQQARPGRVRLIGQRSERGDDRVLPAGDDSHAGLVVTTNHCATV